jgi:tetratricopeptide (TPR) repeat protein/predicted Ser/Thr protein kinase
VNDSADARWLRIKNLFADAIELAPELRAEWIVRTCAGDDGLRLELDALLEAHEQAGRFMEQGALALPEAAGVVAAVTHAAFPATTPARFGGYRIVRELGRGGMGVVYLGARDDDRFEKLVAIKVIAGDLVDPIASGRFLEERRILASLDHPGIARLLDAGTSDTGVPFVIMEYVAGEPIDAYCAAQRLSVRDRLTLFGRVCDAVQYSHERLVVHRDIKARNILVTADGAPKLLDFGIARLLDPAGLDRHATRTAFRALTPESASPEQVRGDPVTVSTDVYSLGVLLYRLLCGRSPYRADLTTASGAARAICEEEPLRPSATPGLLHRRELRGDVDLIILKALRKDAARRYASVDQLAQDIARHLGRLPILAAPDAWTYRTRKFVERQWLGLSAVAAVILALLAGGATTWWQAQRAERRFNDVRRLAHTLMFDIHDAIAKLPGSTSARRLLVTHALEYLDSLAREAGGDPALERELASAYEKMADVLGWPNTPNLGDVHGALTVYHKAQAARQRLLDDEPGNTALLRDLATTAMKISRASFYAGDPHAGAEEARHALAIEEKLATVDPGNAQTFRLARSHSNYGQMLFVSGHTVDSMQQQQKAVAMLETLNASGWNQREVQNRLAVAYGYFASVLRLGKPVAGIVPNFKAALDMQRKALALDELFATAATADTGLQRQVMVDRMNLGENLLQLKDRRGALEQFRQGLASAEALAHADAANLQAQSDLAWVSSSLGQLLAQDGATKEAFGLLNRSQALMAPVVAADPANVNTRSKVAGYNEGFGHAHAARGEWRAAKSRFENAYVFWKEMRDKGVTTGADLERPEALALEIAKCETALR